MRLTRITRISDFRIFRSFTWPTDLVEFGKYNVLYGWNGAGKTTLSTILRHIELKQDLDGCGIELDFEGTPLRPIGLATAKVPSIRVFNRAFMDANLFEDGNAVSPIYVFGEEKIEKQHKLNGLRAESDGRRGAVEKLEKEVTTLQKQITTIAENGARRIKQLLRDSRPTFANYHKGHFFKRIEKIDPETAPSLVLTDERRQELEKKKSEKPRPALMLVTVETSTLRMLVSRVGAALATAAASAKLDELSDDADRAEWVQAGLRLHAKRGANECLYCSNRISRDRASKLRAHFNDAVNALQSDLDAIVADAEAWSSRLTFEALPYPATLYDHLQMAYRLAVSTLRTHANKCRDVISKLIDAVEAKRQLLFESVAADTILPDDWPQLVEAVVRAINDFNAQIKSHNDYSTNFQMELEQATDALELNIIGEAFPEYEDMNRQKKELEGHIAEHVARLEVLAGQIKTLERDILNHVQAAHELNADLSSYLGRTDLVLEAKGSGYVVTRNGEGARHLSEGEKTALAFLYFLKSLSAQDFDRQRGIVVIDDPVSSLDANALFSAFAFMKTRTAEVGQLIILTHNFAFFRQVKRWFSELNGRNKEPAEQRARQYLVSKRNIHGVLTGGIEALPTLLSHFESEYHYLFKRVVDAAEATESANLEEHYGVANIARRLLEAFLAFRYPGRAGSLAQAVEAASFDNAKKVRILRFVHSYSHNDQISEGHDDLSVLFQTQDVMRLLLELIEHEDPKHYQGLMALIRGEP